jgi:hypothetical protein
MGNFITNNNSNAQTIFPNNDTVIEIHESANNKITVILDELEKNGYDQLKELDKKIQTEPIEPNDIGNTLMNIMEQGANKFKEKTGRPMTYAEMRSVYG